MRACVGWWQRLRTANRIAAIGLFVNFASVVAVFATLWVVKGTLDATEKAARATERSVSVAWEQLELSQRPWVYGHISIEEDFKVDESGTAYLTAVVTLLNYGPSVAVGVQIVGDLFPVSGLRFYEQSQARLIGACDAARVNSEWPDKQDIGSRLTLFPKAPSDPQGIATSIPKEVMAANLAPGGDPANPAIIPVLALCVAYRFSFDPTRTVHFSRWLLELYRVDERGEPRSIPTTRTVRAADLRLKPWPFGHVEPMFD